MEGTGFEGLYLFIEIAFRHFWQSLLIIGVVGLLLVRKNMWSAEHRSWIWTWAIVLMAMLPVLTLIPLPDFSGPAGPAAEASRSLPVLLEQAYHYDAEFIAPVTATLSKSFLGSSFFLTSLMLLWAGVSFWLLFQLGIAWRRTEALKAHSTPVSASASFIPREWPGDVAIMESDRVPGPMALGLVAPCVLVPEGLADHLDQKQMRHLLAHELAHIERGDIRFAFLQRLLLALFWWNPLMHIACNRLKSEREMACDDRAVQRGGCSKDYASSLVDSVETLITGNTDMTRLIAVSALERTGKRSFAERVKRLLKADYTGRIRLRHVHNAVLLGTAVVMASIFVLTPRNAFSAVGEHTLKKCCADLITAVKTRDYLAKKQLLVKNGTDVNCVSDEYGTPLIVAAGMGDANAIKFLIKEGAEVDMGVPGYGTALTMAAAKGQLGALKKLIANDADVNAGAQFGKTPLIAAAYYGQTDTIKYLLKNGADPEQTVKTSDGREISALGEAKRKGHKDIVKLLNKYLKYNTGSS